MKYLYYIYQHKVGGPTHCALSSFTDKKEFLKAIERWNNDIFYNFAYIPTSCLNRILSLNEILIINRGGDIHWRLPWPEKQ